MLSVMHRKLSNDLLHTFHTKYEFMVKIILYRTVCSGPRAVQVVEALVLLFNIFKGPIAIFWTIRPNKLNAKEKTPAERQKEVIQLAQQERLAKNQEETAV